MATFQQAQTGNRVYRGTSTRPNQGQVSAQGAQGYIKRELRKKQSTFNPGRPVGGDGKSDRRSTVASQALNRTFQRRPHSGPPGGGPEGPGKQPPKLPNSGPNRGGGGNSPPPVVTNDQGLLELPYDQDYSMEQLGLLDEANQELLGLKVEGDQELLQYGQDKRNAGIEYGNAQRTTLNQNAASGTAFSSQYGTGVANNARGYANQLGDLESQHGAFQQNQLLQRTTIQDSLTKQLQQLTQQYADQLADEAGTLGYGTNKGNVSPGENTSIYGPRALRRKQAKRKNALKRGNDERAAALKRQIENMKNKRK